MTITVLSAEYQTPLEAINSRMIMQRHGQPKNEQIQSQWLEPRIGVNTYQYNESFTISDNQYLTYLRLYFDTTIKTDVTDVYIYLDISDYGITQPIATVAINTSAEIRISGKSWYTDPLFDSTGVLIYKLPAQSGETLEYIELRATLTFSDDIILTKPTTQAKINDIHLIYTQTEADRVIEALKSQTEEEKQEVTQALDKANEAINNLESEANAIDAINKPDVIIDKNPVNIASTSIPGLISTITNNPYLLTLMALVSTLIMLAALLYGV